MAFLRVIMPERLATVKDYVFSVRRLLLDRVRPYRYSDDSIVEALNLALLEARRLRADFFVCRYGENVPSFEGVTGTPVPIEPQFRLPFVYGIAAQVLQRDDDDVNDERANSFDNRFQTMLTGVRPAPVTGGSPGPKNAQQ
jgi:hypothetical protein